MRTLTRLTPYLLAAGVAVFGAACGDDGGGGKADAATGSPDAGPPDAALPPVHKGTIAVTDVSLVTSDQAASLAKFQGGVVDISFENPADTGGGTSIGMNLGSCQVTTYTKTNLPRTPTDEGAIAIGGAALKKPMGTCAYSTDLKKYECTLDSGQGDVDITVDVALKKTFKVVLPKDEAATDLVGSTLRLSGFSADQDDNATNGKQTFNGQWPVVDQADGDAGTEVVTISIGAFTPANPEKKAAKFTLLAGAAPIPTALVPQTKTTVFLDEPGNLTIKKPVATSPGVAALDFSGAPAGKGFSTVGGTRPNEFPFASKKEVTFGCGATCGTIPAGLTVFAISGRTTDLPANVLAALPKDFMPPAESADSFVTSYATFQCAYINAKEGKLTQAAVDAILATHPTRVETRVFLFAGAQGSPTATQGAANLLVGHGEVGHTDAP